MNSRFVFSNTSCLGQVKPQSYRNGAKAPRQKVGVDAHSLARLSVDESKHDVRLDFLVNLVKVSLQYFSQ